MKKQSFITLFSAAALSVALLNLQSCTKEPEDDPGNNNNTGYSSSDDIAKEDLVAKFSFENSMDDAKGNISNVTTNSITYGTGAKGSCYTGSADGYAHYESVGDAIKNLQSVTISSWVKTVNHADGAESWFQLLNDSNWIGNLFVIQESGADANDSVRIKFTMNKWDAPAWKEQWVDLQGDNRLIIGNNEWHHVAITYDAVASKVAFYVDGKEMMMTEDVTNRFGDDPANGGGPLGPLQFKNANRFVFGCYNQNLPGGAPDAWMKHFDGSLDEFRIYSKALPASDVEFLYNLESEGK
jgi:hypothetical protein